MRLSGRPKEISGGFAWQGSRAIESALATLSTHIDLSYCRDEVNTIPDTRLSSFLFVYLTLLVVGE